MLKDAISNCHVTYSMETVMVIMPLFLSKVALYSYAS